MDRQRLDQAISDYIFELRTGEFAGKREWLNETKKKVIDRFGAVMGELDVRLSDTGVKRRWQRRKERVEEQGIFYSPTGVAARGEEAASVNFESSGNTATVTGKGRITTLEQLLDVCEVDRAIWEVERHLINKWEVGAKEKHSSLDYEKGAATGFVREEGMIVHPLFQVKAWLVRKTPIKFDWPQIQPVEIKPTPVKRGVDALPDNGLMRAVVIPDSQNGYWRDMMTGNLNPFHDRLCWDLALQAVRSVQPHLIVLLGDMLDLPEWSQKFVRSPEVYFTTQPAIKELAWWLWQLRASAPRAKIKYIPGNHECFDDKTEILTDSGWVMFNELGENQKVGTLNIAKNKIEYQIPDKIHKYEFEGELSVIQSGRIDLAITDNHRVWMKANTNAAWQMKEISKIHTGKNKVYLRTAGTIRNSELEGINDDEIRIAAWLITDGGYSKTKHNYVTFYQRKSKHHLITEILDRLGWSYSVSERKRKTKRILNKLLKSQNIQCDIYLHSPHQKKLHELVPDKKKIPAWVYSLSDRQFRIFLESMIDGDGSRHKSCPDTSWMFYSSNKGIVDSIQIACVTHRFRASIVEYRSGEFRVNITPGDTHAIDKFGEKLKKERYSGYVWCVTTKNDTVIIRRNGRVAITGNSRLPNAMASNMLAAARLNSVTQTDRSQPLMSVPTLLGLDEMGISYEDEYPDGIVWINDNLSAEHGTLARKGGGATTQAEVRDSRHSKYIGHCHRVECACRTVFPQRGPLTYKAISPGTIARIDGLVPGVKKRQDWQQGLSVVHYEPGNGIFTDETVNIYGQRMILSGQVYEGKDRSEQIADECKILSTITL